MGGVHLSDPFRVRADAFIVAVLTRLDWTACTTHVKRTERQLRAMLPFEAVGETMQHRRMPISGGRKTRWLEIPDVPDAAQVRLPAYLCEIAGFNPERAFDEQGSAKPAEEHAEVLRALSPDVTGYLR